MTIEEIIGGKSASELAKLSDKELTELFEKEGFLNVTRPDRVDKMENMTRGSTATRTNREDDAKVARGKALAKQYGLDLGEE